MHVCPECTGLPGGASKETLGFGKSGFGLLHIIYITTMLPTSKDYHFSLRFIVRLCAMHMATITTKFGLPHAR